MATSNRRPGYIAFDHGPQLTLQPLASRLPGAWLHQTASGRDCWADALRDENIKLLICGTSDTPTGRVIEGDARVAAVALGIPVVVIEDFPGNFNDVPHGRPQLLVVESDFAARLARAKAPGAAQRVHVGPCIRYDPLRRRLDELRRPFGQSANSVLWVGQPETRDSIETLACVIHALRPQGVDLWFRAHPRDEGYAAGAYERLLKRKELRVDDVSALPLADCLERRPRLVVTQFSSVAVEAGFWGIPGLNALLPDYGRARLAEKKSYAIPPWCDLGAAFLVTDAAQMEATLDRGLNAGEARAEVQATFDRYFRVYEEGAPALIKLLYNQRFL